MKHAWGMSLVALLLAAPCVADIRAVTETGREVILRDDGKWVYVDANEEVSDTKKLATVTVNKASDASFLVKGKKVDYGIWINPKKWAFKTNEDGSPSEYAFTLRNGDAYGMVIAEQMEVPLESLKTIALANAKKVAPDAKVVSEGIRIVNGVKLAYMETTGTMHGIKFVYMANYYSGTNGSIQIVGYTSHNLAEKYRANLDEFINGFVAQVKP